MSENAGINQAIEKLEYLKTHDWNYNVPRCKPWKTEKIDEIINDLKSIEKVTRDDIYVSFFTERSEETFFLDMANNINKRIWGE